MSRLYVCSHEDKTPDMMICRRGPIFSTVRAVRRFFFTKRVRHIDFPSVLCYNACVSTQSHIFMDTINFALFICYVSSLVDGWEYESFFS